MVTGADLHPYRNGTRQGDVGYIVFGVPDLERAMTFYRTVLGWSFSSGSYDQGRQVEDVAPKTGLAGGVAPGGLSICWRVDDIAGAVDRVRAAGGTAAEPVPQPHGPGAECNDDQGTQFYLWQPTADQAAAERDVGDDERPRNGHRHGDVSYLTLEVGDAARLCAFYVAVLGWRFPRSDYDGDPESTMPMIGIWGGCDRATGVAMYRVDDIAVAVARVRDAGGTATEPASKPYGLTSDCTDDQGIRFYLGQD
ncbi:MAG: VOC family protein [Acidimicrobiia bacterium]